MIQANIRAQVSEADFDWMIQQVSTRKGIRPDEILARTKVEGADWLIDEAATHLALRADTDISLALIALLAVRRAFLIRGLTNRPLSDYVGSLLLEFHEDNTAPALGPGRKQQYLVDILSAATEAEPREAFELQSHLGNFSLWMSGVFPDWIDRRESERGAPGIRYYEQMGAAGFSAAARHPLAAEYGLQAILRDAAIHFRELRLALNSISDELLWPDAITPEGRILRSLERER